MQWNLKKIVAIGVLALAAIGMLGYFAIESAKINRQKEVEIKEIEKEQTEERAQFWQKLVPWGKDEQEESE